MKVDEAIKWFEAKLAIYGGFEFLENPNEAAKMALAALRAQQEAAKNEPLTIEELRGMVGQPVWIEPTKDTPDSDDWDPAWVILREDYVFVYSKSSESRVHIRFLKDYGKTWLAYRRQPVKGM